MPQLRITAGRHGPALHGPRLTAQGPDDLERVLRAALRADPGPVTVMIHGYKYLPGHPRHCPHQSLLSDRPRILGPTIVSWPHRLGLRGQRGEGLGLSFGWAARGSIWRAFREACAAGGQLARLLAMLHRADPRREVHIVAHSLGVRVALEAIGQSAPGAVDKAILLAGAEFQTSARAALVSPGGRGCAVLNVSSGENDLYDFLFERLIRPPERGDRVLGAGPLRLPNVLGLQLDDGESLDVMRGFGFAIAAPERRVCHWSPYLRPGVFPLYRAFLAGQLDLASLRHALPCPAHPRWSRLGGRRLGPGAPGPAALTG